MLTSSNPIRRTMLVAQHTVTVLLGAMFLASVVGCASAGDSARITLRSPHALIEVEGRGSVERSDGSIACNAGSDRCAAEWTELDAPSLRAKAAPGWHFDRWEWAPVDTSLASGTATTHAYKAIFRHGSKDIASHKPVD